MFPNQMGPPDGHYDPYYNNSNLPLHPQFNQTPYNPTGYGRPTPHPPQGMNNLPPPLGPSWNINHHFPPPTHQAPQSSTNFTTSIHHQSSTFAYQMNNTNQRNQFQHPTGPHHLPCQPPPAPVHLPVPPSPYGHHPSSQYMMPQMFPGGEMLHQGCPIPGGPPGGLQSEMLYNNNNHLVDQHLRHMQNIHLNVPPGNPNRAPLHPYHQNNFQREKPQQDTGIPQHANNVPWRFDRPDSLLYPHKRNPDPGAREMNQGMYDQWAPAPSPQSYECSSHAKEQTPRSQLRSQSANPSRWTPAKNVLERNTAPCFDESSEELAEIFADNPNRGAQGSESCSERSSILTTSSEYVFNSDDDGFDIFLNVDEEFGSKRVFSEGTINRGQNQDTCQKPVHEQENKTCSKYSTTNNYLDNNNSSQGIKSPHGLTLMNQQEQPPADQLQKVGNYLKGLLKVDVTHCHGNPQSKPVAGQESRAGRKSKSPNDGPTIRSLIDRPIYNNCESRLMNKNSKGGGEEKAEVSVPSHASNAIKRINIQRITTHFRVLFEPIPDMFAE